MRDYWLKHRNQSYRLRQGETTIGRSPYCSIVVESKLASRHHAAVRVSSQSLEISDLGSRNGTRVNGKPLVGQHPLNIGDQIQIGEEILTVTGEVTRRGSVDQTLDLGVAHGETPATEAPRKREAWEESTLSIITKDDK